MDPNNQDASEVYDFDAPNEVVDLAEMHNAPNDDHWFETRGSGDLCTPLRTETRTHTAHESAHTEAKDVGASQPPSNIVTSWSGDPKPTVSSNQPQRVSKRKMETSGPPVKKQRKSPESQPQRKSSRLQKNNVRATRRTSSLQTASTELSSEELELQRMKKLQQEVALHRRKNEASYKAALAGNPPVKKLVLATTVPKEFNFKTDARIKTSAAANVAKEVNFVEQLRKPSSPVRVLRSTTVPKPFNLSTGRKRKEEAAPYVPMAQQVQMFHKRTPERFHQPSRQAQERGPSPVKPSQKPTVKEPTIPEGFNLQVEKRLQERQAKRPPVEEPEEEEPPQPFKSNPVPKKILEGVVGVPEKKASSVTVPESPAFALRKRIRAEPAPVEVKPPSPIRAPPVPHFCLPFQPKLPEHHQVEMCPFSFEQREQERRILKEKKLEQLRNEEAPKFKAQLLPDFSSVVLPEKKKLEPTKPEPFNLQSDARGHHKKSRWEHMVEEEKKQQEEATHFKARPCVVVYKEPFKPKKEERADTSSSAPTGFQLQTERRAREWQEIERRGNEKEALKAFMEEQRRKEQEEREKDDITRLRQEQVHKAQPVRHFRGVKVVKSDLPLTVPQSPNFSDRFRM